MPSAGTWECDLIEDASLFEITAGDLGSRSVGRASVDRGRQNGKKNPMAATPTTQVMTLSGRPTRTKSMKL